MTQTGRSGDFRYTVLLAGADITPLASIEASLDGKLVRVLNVSLGGVALLYDDAPQLSEGDIFDASISVRERGFPIQLEVKGIRGLRLSFAFVNPSRAFLGALREFLHPKFLGGSLVRQTLGDSVGAAVELVPGAESLELFLGQNQTAVFVWLGADRRLLRLVGISQDLVFERSAETGIRTGRLPAGITASEALNLRLESPGDDSVVRWDRVIERTVVHYFADIFLSWLTGVDQVELAEAILNDEDDLQSDSAAATTRSLRFPKF